MTQQGGLVRRVATGAAAGAIATVPMSAVMLASRRFGVMRRRQPPEAIVAEAAAQADVDADPEAIRATAVVAHFAFGAGAGALFGALVRGPMAARVAAGVGYGLAVWLVSYRGWIPRVGLMPHADVDEPERQATMAAAHVAFGAALGALTLR